MSTSFWTVNALSFGFSEMGGVVNAKSDWQHSGWFVLLSMTKKDFCLVFPAFRILKILLSSS
jgi:hypothetical protein